MSSLPPVQCTHDVGPGITVCLRCRQQERQAIHARQLRLLMACGVATLALVAVYVAGASAANAWRSMPRRAEPREEPRLLASTAVKPQPEPKVVDDAPAPVTPTPVVSVSGTPAATAAVAAPPPSTVERTSPPLAVVVRQGRTDHADSVIVERTGDSVVVDFDTQMGRTRRRDKFERIVRQTLPIVYGRRADSLLATIPVGGITGDGDLFTDLPKRGIHLPLGDRWMLEIWPETREGRDGPLVISYWARVKQQ